MTSRFLLSIRIAATALIAFVQTPAAVAQSSPPVINRDSALELAQTLNSDANIVGSDADDEKLIALIPELFGSKEDLAALEKEYPGISVEVARAVLPRINQSARARLPELWRRQAALYRSSFTPVEIDRLIAFYQSPTGAKMLASLYRRIKPTTMLAEAKASDDFKISPDSALKDIRATAPAILADMDAADQKRVFETFGDPGLAAKMRVMAPKTQGIVLDWMHESEPGEDVELVKLITATIERREKQKARK